MKRCPNCGLKYADDSMQFCLTDGTGLVSSEIEEPATFISGTATQTAARQSRIIDTPEFAPLQQREPTESPQTKTETAVDAPAANEQTASPILTYAPIVVALAQNYWQWLYMNEYNSFRFPAFFWELNFWVWLILTFGGAALCVFSIRKSKNKSMAVVGLVILAINFLLCLVPRR